MTNLTAVATQQPVNNYWAFRFEFIMFLLFTAVFLAAGLVTIDLLTEVRA